VENGRRWSKATQVQIFLTAVQEQDVAGVFKAIWLGEIPLKWRHMSSLNPDPVRVVGYPAEADLVALFQRAATLTQPLLQLQPLIAPSPLDVHRIKECKLRVILQARGMEADSNFLTVEIAWDGKWADKADAQMSMVVREVKQRL